MYLPNVWNRFIEVDPSIDELNANAAVVAATFREAKTNKTFSPLLSDNRPIIMISKAGMGERVQLTSCHHFSGSFLTNPRKSVLCLSGFQPRAPIEVETADVSRFSTQCNLPDISTLLQATTITDLDAVPVADDKSDRVRNVAVLVPKFGKPLTSMQDMSAKNCDDKYVSENY